MNDIKIINPKRQPSTYNNQSAKSEWNEYEDAKQQIIQRRLVLGVGGFFAYLAIGIFLQSNFDKFISYMYFMSPIALGFIWGFMKIKKNMDK